MSPDRQARIREVQDKLAVLQRARVRAEHERDQASAAADRARVQLATEFGVDTVEEAKALFHTLDTELQDHIDALSGALEELSAALAGAEV